MVACFYELWRYWPRSLVLNLIYSAYFFSRNSVFLSQQFSRNSVFQPVSAKVQTQRTGCLNRRARWSCTRAWTWSQFLTTSFENHARRSGKLHFHDMWTICHFLFLTTVMIRGIFIYLLTAGRWHVAWACTYACDGVRVPMVRIVYHVCACVYLGISTRVWVYPFFCLLFVIFFFIYYTDHHGTFV